MDLKIVAQEIRDILEKRRNEIQLSFVEEGHIYYMLDEYGKLRNDYPSVSTVEKFFYEEFDAHSKALQMCRGDIDKQQKLLKEWADLGLYASNQGSRMHFELEKYAVDKFGINKEVRSPIFECDSQQLKDSDNMIKAGIDFINLMESRGCYLIDTEVVLGDQKLGYVGQTDNIWVMEHNKQLSIIVTDHKSNKPINFTVKPYNGYLEPPFQKYRNYALTHYFLQLPFYFRLFKDMLKGSKYENIKLSGCIIDSLRADGTFVEYRIPKDFYEKVLALDIKTIIENGK